MKLTRFLARNIFSSLPFIFASLSVNAQTIVPGGAESEFAVSNGAATYSFPIDVAPGRADMQPELALSYSSAGNSDGSLGVGWSLGGVSAITRCGRTLAQDGAKSGIGFNGNDRYCLGGQRLIPVNGANGGTGVQYRTEVDSYSKITSHGGTANNPAYWTVRTKAGQVITYGGSGNATLRLSQGNISWSIRTINDTTGNNAINYHYFINRNSQYLDRITYVGGSVDLVYQAGDKPDTRTTYFLGNTITSAKRLDKVVTYAYNAKQQEYRLRYQNAGLSQSSTLHQIQVCSAQNTCFKPVNFTWDRADYNINGYSSRTWSAVTPRHMRNGDGNRRYKPLMGDFNGDGKMDVATVSPNGGGAWSDWFAMEISTGNNFNSRVWNATTAIHMRNGDSGREYQPLVGDFNGDGLSDIATISKNGGGGWADWLAMELSTGNGFRSQTWRATTPNHMRNGNSGREYQSLTGDFNGDGLTDIATISKNGGGGWADWVAMELSTGSGFRSQTWRATTPIHMRNGNSGRDYEFLTGDFNGDGLTDIATITKNGGGGWADWISMELSTGTGFRSQTWTAATPIHMRNGGSGNDYRPMVGDFNGDGLDDIATISRNGGGGWSDWLAVELSTGTGFSSRTWQANTPAHMRNGGVDNNYMPFVGDFNADGLSDIVTISPNGGGAWADWMSVALSNRNGFLSQTWRTTTPRHMRNGNAGRRYYPLAGDFNGDGRTDMVTISPNGGGAWDSWLAVELSHAPTSNRIKAITANGNSPTRISYKALTDASVYKKGSGSQYPYIDLQFAAEVVSQVEADNGAGGVSRVQYRYEGLKANARGRGLLGYRKITETFTDTGKSVESTFYQHGGNYERSSPTDSYTTSFPFAGTVQKVVERRNGRVLNEATTKYYANPDHPAFSNPRFYQLKLQQSVEKSYELNESLVTQVVTTHSNIDHYGNVGRVKIDTSGSGQTFTKITDSDYSNNTSAWHLGRLNYSVTTHRSPGQPDQRRRVQFTYNAQGLLREEKIVSAANPSEWIKRSVHDYNGYGQETRVTVYAPGESTRVTSMAYDGQHRLQRTCNAYNECSTNTYNGNSQLASTTGPNGITTRWTYDGFGRQIREDRADGTWSTNQHRFENCAPVGGRTADTAYSCLVTQTKGSPPQYSQYDKLGRTVRTVKRGFDGRWIYSDTEYDRFSRVSRVSRDYYDGEHVYWATSQYDALDRVTRVTQPGPHGSVTAINYQYNGLVTTIRSGPEQRAKVTRNNAIGQAVRIDEPMGTYVEHTYFSDGSLKSSRVNGNDATLVTYNYDRYGRKTESTDPDLGRWRYQYNGFGDLIRQTNAKGQVAQMSYDRVGRLVRRVEPEGTSTWTYGRNSGANVAPAGSIGKLLTESAPGITKDFSYDNLGRIEATTTSIAGQDSFTVENSYDGNGRIKRVTYPGTSGFFTENVYNRHGYLSIVRGLRRHAQTHDYRRLTPLISQAISVADEYERRAQKLRQIGNYYKTQISYYRSLSGSGQKTSGLTNQLNSHRNQLNGMVNQGQALSPKFMGHLNHTLDELQAVNRLINTQVQSYRTIADQLTTLAEQTLAEADHQFQYSRTYDYAANAYNEMDNTPTGTSGWINYWRGLQMDASGRMMAEVYGNGIVNDYSYNQGTGHLEAINSSLLVVDAIRHVEYEYDAYDNVTLRDDLVNDIRETYTYDKLDRLLNNAVSSQTYSQNEFNRTNTVRYDGLGNITSKTGVGGYRYGENGAGPHAVTTAGSRSYRYDANGNMVSGDGRNITWTSYNKASRITRSGRSVDFKYGADRARFQKTNHSGDVTLYVGGLYEEVRKASGVNEKKHYIFAGGQVVAEHIISSQRGTQTRYLHKDALGSVDLVTDAHANVVDRRSFDAWGKMRNLPWKANANLNDPLYLTQLPFTNKGFTGHEHVQEVGLIHMNGRMYDANIGRFLSADPHIQAPEMGQNYNRYSYVLNNPMKYSDPSGYFFKKLFRSVKKAFKAVARAVKRVFEAVKPYAGLIVGAALTLAGCIVCGSGLVAGILNGAAVGAIVGAAGALANGGNVLRGAAFGALSGGVFGGIGALDLGTVAGALAHGVAGGTLSVIQGGKFGQGFLSAGFAKFATKLAGFNYGNGSFGAVVGRTAFAAVVGGTASVLGGGKFANGAKTAAFAHLLNAELSGFKYRARVRSWRQAEAAEAAYQRQQGRRVIRGTVRSRYDGDYYVRGRTYDVVSVDRNGHYHLVEVKYRSRFTRLALSAISIVPVGRLATLAYRGINAAGTLRQIHFDYTISTGGTNEITLSGRGLPGGSVTLSPGDYTVHWALVGRGGAGVRASFNDEQAVGSIIQAALR